MIRPGRTIPLRSTAGDTDGIRILLVLIPFDAHPVIFFVDTVAGGAFTAAFAHIAQIIAAVTQRAFTAIHTSMAGPVLIPRVIGTGLAFVRTLAGQATQLSGPIAVLITARSFVAVRALTPGLSVPAVVMLHLAVGGQGLERTVQIIAPFPSAGQAPSVTLT